MGGGVLGHRVRRGARDVDGCGEAVRRPRPRTALPAAAGVAASAGRWSAAVAGAGGSPRRPSCSPRMRRGLWTGTWRRPRTGSDPVQLDRLVDEAIGRYMPDEAERRRLEHADGRYFTVESRQVHSFDGTLAVHGELDIADALELETAIQTVAAQLKDLGSTESLDVRRSMAVGELARRELALEFSVVEEGAPRPSRNHHPQDRALRPPLPGRPDRPPRTRQPPDHPRPAPRPVRCGQPGGRRNRSSTRPPTTPSTLRWCRTGTAR